MGEVYKVLHLHLNSIRVIKLMRASIASEPGADDRFIREARLATRINHPNVAALYDFSTLEDGSRYMVWEYIEGTNLHELIETNGPLTPRYAAKLAIEALHGLEAIHRAGIVHRDISPENIMICPDEEGTQHVKLIDLGIAKQGDATDASKTATGMFVGKWKYCSPEHLGMLDAGERIDGRADLYSFGIVLYEMLTGVPPFQADTPHAYVMLHSSERPKALRDVNPNVTASPDLERILFKSLEKDRRKRFANAREFANALEEVMPSLDDRAGARSPLPAAVETTEEATRIVKPTPAQADVATVVTARGDAGNIVLDRVHAVRTVEQPKRQARAPVATLIVAIVVIAAGVAAWMLRKNEAPVVKKEPVKAAVVIPTPTPAPLAAHLGINAFPWANVTRIRNIDSGADVPMKESLVTPAPLELAPGRYEVTLSNPQFHDAIRQTVEVAPGEERTIDVHFADPSQAQLPRFGGVE
jgi:serine/threonine-protein kinase